MPGNPGQRPVEATVSGSSGGTAVATNLTQVNGTAVSNSNAVPVSQAPTTGTTAATMGSAFKTVSATNTPERLAAATTLVTSVVLQGYKAQGTVNVGNVYIGTASTDASQPIAIISGGSMSLSAPPGKFIDLNLIYVDVANANDGVGYFYVS